MGSTSSDGIIAKVEQALSNLLTNFDQLQALTLNYQNIPVPIVADSNSIVSRNLKTVKIGFSVLDFSIVAFMIR